jgi:DNA-binding response OmpR family regulator
VSKRILLIEDDCSTRELYTEVLTEAGFEVIPVSDGQEGLAKTYEGGYDLILLDLMMPKLDGLGFLTSLQENPPKVANGPIVLITNLAHDEVVQEGLKKGAATYLVKVDLTPGELVEKVKHFLA